jgi:O-antigen/teichoic acid export membrane protein
MTKQLLHGTLVYSIAAVVAAGLNTLFYTLGKYLGPEEFGRLSALIAVVYVISVVQSIFTGLVAKVVSSQSFSVPKFAAKLTPIILKAELVFAFMFLAASALVLAGFLKIYEWQPYLWIALLIMILFVQAIYRGVLQGAKQFNEFALLQILEAVSKLGFAFLAVGLGFGTSGVIFALALSSLMTLVIGKLLSRRIKSSGAVNLKTIFPSELLASVSVGFVMLNLIFVVDSLVARNKLSAIDSGYYGAVITFGKFIYFLSNAVTLALFPLAADKRSDKKLLYSGLVVTIVFSLAGLALFVLFGAQLTQFIFGSNFAGINNYLPIQGLIAGLYSLVSIISVYLLGKDRYRITSLLGLGLVLQLGLLMIFTDSIQTLLNLQIVIMSVILAACLLYLFYVEHLHEKLK